MSETASFGERELINVSSFFVSLTTFECNEMMYEVPFSAVAAVLKGFLVLTVRDLKAALLLRLLFSLLSLR